MKVLAIITNILLGTFIVISSFMFVSNNTADLNYLNSTAKESNVYEGAAKAATKAFLRQAKEETNPEQQSAAKELAKAIDKEYITEKVQDLLKQFEDFSEGQTDSVKLDLKDLVERASKENAELVRQANIEPIVLIKNEDGGVKAYKVLDSAKVGAVIVYILTGLLAIASLVLSIIRKRYLGLAITLLASGLFVMLSAVAGTVFNLTLAGSIKMPEDVSVLNPYIQEFARMVVGDIARQYLLIAACLLLGSVVFFVLDKKMKPKEDPAKPVTEDTASEPRIKK